MGDDPKLRKLRPVYEALQSFNFKGAIKLASRKDLAAHPVAKVRARAPAARVRPRTAKIRGLHLTLNPMLACRPSARTPWSAWAARRRRTP